VIKLLKNSLQKIIENVGFWLIPAMNVTISNIIKESG
jgi:hypothetical protein